jgi:hypothetical protein
MSWSPTAIILGVVGKVRVHLHKAQGKNRNNNNIIHTSIFAGHSKRHPNIHTVAGFLAHLCTNSTVSLWSSEHECVSGGLYLGTFGHIA